MNLLRCRTEILSSGPLAVALNASVSVPGMFTPVRHEKGLLVDGAVGDPTGCWGLPSLPSSGRVLALSFDQNVNLPYSSAAAPHKLRAELLSNGGCAGRVEMFPCKF